MQWRSRFCLLKQSKLSRQTTILSMICLLWSRVQWRRHRRPRARRDRSASSTTSFHLFASYLDTDSNSEGKSRMTILRVSGKSEIKLLIKLCGHSGRDPPALLTESERIFSQTKLTISTQHNVVAPEIVCMPTLRRHWWGNDGMSHRRGVGGRTG